ncbi:hypothetical protein K1T71_008134 [Dendrolimus kikuchii]|uniref:Uncharacterized protein n=1 Tax=Dendrolimus kikuchii TaxID=765133 RepID=A0ACC1CWM4_9NEOP|nr:hypothetical protein K1T71_008134 [Dendrolimus kikuchii]
MAPVPKKENIKFHSISKNEESTQLTGDEVVISGISGIYPNSENVLQFMENLYGKKEMINYDSSGQQHPEFPKRFGKLKNWQEFDAQFFRVTHTQANSLNLLSRLLLENAFNAMFDAGINPITLSGSRVGVYIGSSSTDPNLKVYNRKDANNFIISGFGQTMLANRISYWLNATGPSYAVDLADASSALCLELACKAIRTGDCDAAIVGACNCCINPFPSISMKRLGFLSLDGKTKCFTETGDGNVRSEGVGVLFLQKARDAKRIYGEICHVKGKYFPDSDGTFLHTRNPNQIEEFLQEFYSEIKISADDVDFIEANAIGFAKSDRQELEAISNLFGRRKPIKVGTVKSNVGHVESNSAICAIIKICLAYQKGLMPGNLYDNEPQNLIKTENDGRVQILTDHTPIKQGAYIAINNFSFTGGNYHILLKDHHKSKAFRNEKFSVPYLILVSGRQEKSVNKILDHLGNNPIDVEEIALLRNIFQHDIPAYTSRGYIILDDQQTQGTNILNRHLNHYPGDKRPVWFLYSGMGSQWQKMGLDLLKIPIFAQSIEKCQKVLIPLGINLLQILSDPDESIFDNILNCFVGIAAVQIGLTDILKEIGIVPDNLIGHSVGELGCAYADGCLTAEEMILCAYYRGLVSIKTNFIKGSMAAVGLGYKAILKLCPPGIAVACHNSDHSSTISGPADKVKQFVAKLTNLGIFAKEVPTANIAYHSEYIREAGPGLLKYMKGVIIDPKLRSEKWLCTSAPRDKWNTAKYASAEYFTNNLLSPVYFEETALLIPNNALVIEIAPHGLLQAIVKRSHPECHHIPLTRRDTKDSIVFLLSAIGKMYEAGLNPKMESMYPKVNFPVSTDTPSLSHLVEWEHSEKWDTYTYSNAQKIVLANRAVMVLLYDDEYKYIEDHVINGVTILPSAAVLVFVWETLAMYNNADYRNVSVIFQNVQIYCEVKVETEEPLKLNVEIQKGFQYFEVTYDDILIAKGKVGLVVKTAPYQLTREDYDYENWTEGHNLYKILNARGYSYKGEFQSIRRINFEKSQACIEWNNNWVAFLDGLIQLNMSFRDHNGISNINFINELVIDPKNHKHVKTVNVDDKTCYIAEVNHDLYGITECGGVKMEYITFIDYEKPVYDFILSNKRSRNLKVSNKSVTDSSNVNTSVPLNNFQLTNVQLEEIKSIVREYADIDYPMSALKRMSLASILESTKKKDKKVVSSIDSGITAFYKYICDDDYDASEPIVTMATKLVPTIEREEFLDPEDTYLLMIPGFDGHSHIFRNLAEKLNLKALTLQLPPDYKNDSVETIAKNIYKYLKDRIKINSKFYILGYSFGVLVALELAYILEKEGNLGVVYCLDSSPKALRAQLDAYLGKLGKYELQNTIVMHFHRLLLKENSDEFKEMLRNTEDWQSKIRLFTMQAKQKLTISHEYLGCCLDSFYRRILLAYDYKPNFKLDSELVLIKGVPHPEAITLNEDYGLSDYTSLPVQVFDIKSDHALASYDSPPVAGTGRGIRPAGLKRAGGGRPRPRADLRRGADGAGPSSLVLDAAVAAGVKKSSSVDDDRGVETGVAGPAGGGCACLRLLMLSA